MKIDGIVRKAIDEYDMIGEGKRILVGFSGGADSLCLLHMLHSFGYDVTAAHLNHNMRPTAERDMNFCAEFCKAHNIPFVVKIMEKDALKNENSARVARYDFFYKTMSDYGIDLLATAHNKDDSAETVLLHMLRGAALDGLCGISPKDGRLIRPLVFAKKADIIEYCRQNGLNFVTDETNLTDVYSRNKLRNRFIPELSAEFNPTLIDALADNALILSRDAQYMRECAEAELERLCNESGVDTAGLLALNRAVSTRVIQLLWKNNVKNAQNLPRIYIDAIYELARKGKSGSKTDLPRGMCARICYNRLEIAKREINQSFCREVCIGEWCEIPEADIRLLISGQEGGQRICISGDEKITVRSRKNGDSFVPLGMNGSKKLSDYMIDEKIPSHTRGKIPILCVNGEVAAVVGRRIGAKFACGKNVYYIKTEPLQR